MNKFEEIPCQVFITYQLEWEDYGLCGDVNGGPIASGYYTAFDWEGIDDIGISLRDKLDPYVKDSTRMRAIIEQVGYWINEHSVGVAVLQDLADAFDLDGKLEIADED